MADLGELERRLAAVERWQRGLQQELARSTAGQVNVLGNLSLAGALLMTGTDGRIDYYDKPLAAAGIAVLADTNKPHGLLIITETLVTASNALFFVNGGNNTVEEVADPDTAYSASAAGDDFNVYYDAGDSRYELQNNTGAAVRFRYWLLEFAR